MTSQGLWNKACGWTNKCLTVTAGGLDPASLEASDTSPIGHAKAA